MSPILSLQRRMMELGRVRLGERGPKGEPKKLDTFRFTSASKGLLEAVAALYGGTVREWKNAPDEGYYEVTTKATELNIILPPVFSQADGTSTTSWSQWFEHWTAAGCQKRCDGVTEALSGEPCMCDPDERECQVTTRVSFMLPDIPGLGVWRLDSKGINAAVELPGTLEVLMMAAHERQFIPAVLRIVHRSKKRPGQPIRRYVVPVLDLPQVKIGELLAGGPVAVNAPQPRPPRPALPAGTEPPVDTTFDAEETAAWGEPPTTDPLTPEADQLTATLRDLAKQLGSTAAVDKAIEKKGAETADEPGKYQAWLKTQIARAEAKLETSEPGESDFVRMAQDAQAAKTR